MLPSLGYTRLNTVKKFVKISSCAWWHTHVRATWNSAQAKKKKKTGGGEVIHVKLKSWKLSGVPKIWRICYSETAYLETFHTNHQVLSLVIGPFAAHVPMLIHHPQLQHPRACLHHRTFFLHHWTGGSLLVVHQVSIESVHLGDWMQVGGPFSRTPQRYHQREEWPPCTRPLQPTKSYTGGHEGCGIEGRPSEPGIL